MATVLVKSEDDKKIVTESTTSLNIDDVPPLGAPHEEKRFWFQRTKNFDGEAIATQPSVFDDPKIAEQYHPRDDWYVTF